MNISEIILLGIILLISIMMERKTGNINPLIWLAGGIIALVYGVLGIGVVSWIESLICLVLAFGGIIIFSACFGNAIGGGALKGLCICAMFLGRYIIITIILLVLVIGMAGIIKKDSLLEDSRIYAMPIITFSVAITVAVIYII